jgi:DNA repair exonuclease SbcCD nuclease subunit
MKVLVTADHHHHAWKQFAKPLEGGLNSRLKEGLDAEDALARIIAKYGVELHLRLGDLFHQKNVLDMVVFNEVFERIAAAPCQTVILEGNHDWAAGGARHSLESLKRLRGVLVVDDLAMLVHAGFVVHALPYFESRDALVEACASLRPVPGKFNLLAAHLGINGAKDGSEYRIPSTLGVEDLALNRFDLCFFGHYHKEQQVAPNAHYVGTLIPRSFADLGSGGTAILLDTTTGEWRRISVAGPQYMKLRIPTMEAFEAFIEGRRTKGEPDLRNSYVWAVAGDIQLTRSAVEEAVGECLGLKFEYEVDKAPETRLSTSPSAESATWRDHLHSWVDRSSTTLDKDRLRQVGEAVINEALMEVA